MSGPTGASDNSNNWSMIESSKKNRENTAGASDVDEEDTDGELLLKLNYD